MSNLKVERARKLGIENDGHQQEKRGRAASCTDRLPSMFYRRQEASKGDQTNFNSVSSFTAGGPSLSSSTLVTYNYKRKYSFDVKSLGGPTGGAERGFSKRRKKDTNMIPPTKFLLGGNISDPLNLNSFIDEKLGTPIKQLTPVSSPMPTPKHRQQVEVLIPPNINDPLNLNGGEEAGDLELNLVSPKTKKRKRPHKRKNSEAEDEQKTSEQVIAPPQTLSLAPLHKTKRSASGDKIVSPVIPQPTGLTRKRFSSGHSKSQSCDGTASGSRRKKQQHSGWTQQKSQKKNHERFIHGNYNRYYGYRNPESGVDTRVSSFKKEWFEGKDILDIGCNIGHVTFCVARDFNPKKIIGLDIDETLITVARKNIFHYLKKETSEPNQFPISLPICHGPIVASMVLDKDRGSSFPNNVCFVQCDYVPKSDAVLEVQRQEFDVILCLSLTKWVHLNCGDEGLKRMFKRIYRQLRPGGKLILEAQAWSSYSHRKRLSENIFKNYHEIRLMPEYFNSYLLSKEVGFSTCEVICVPFNASEGFRRPIQLFTKGGESPTKSSE